MTQTIASATILDDASRYCAAAGIKLSTLGLYAVGNSRLFANLKAGRPCLTTTLDRVYRYMAEHPCPAPTTPPAENPACEGAAVNALLAQPQVAAE